MEKFTIHLRDHWLLYLLVAISTLAVIVYWYFVKYKIGEISQRGQFGDTFGGLTSLFTAYAFAGLIYTIILQSKELSLQRNELRLTREEFAAMKKAQESSAQLQEKSLTVQAITTNIQMLSTISQGRYSLISDINIQDKKKHYDNYISELEANINRLNIRLSEEVNLGASLNQIEISPIRY